MGLGGAPIIQQPSIMQQQAQHSNHGHSMHFEQLEQQAPVMDEFLDQMFAMPPFVDMGNIGARAGGVGLQCGQLGGSHGCGQHWRRGCAEALHHVLDATGPTQWGSWQPGDCHS